MINSLLAGAIFGAALTAAGVYSPSVIIGQMQLSDWHMLKVFLTASASSAIAILLGQCFNLTKCTPRTPNTLNLFSAYDGNLIGGTLLGIGMALSGACPGTLLPQVATGVASGVWVLLGGLIGGVIFTGFVRRRVKIVKVKEDVSKAAESRGEGQVLAVGAYVVLCLAGVAIAASLTPEKTDTHLPSVLGGLFIGLSQFTSLYLTTSTLGVSNVYEQLGDLFWWMTSSLNPNRKSGHGSLPVVRGTIFPLGTLLGSFALSKLLNIGGEEMMAISKSRAVVGGVLLVVGARIAGGCTSGHGISGMSQLSVASFLTAASMFGGGIGFSVLLRAFW